MANPTRFTRPDHSGGIVLPVTASMATNNSLPPSSAGNGNKLMTARFKDIIAVKVSKAVIPKVAASPTNPTIPTGPAT